MNFDHLVADILNEYNDINLLALDGRREIYTRTICQAGNYMRVNPLIRRKLDEEFLKDWDNDTENLDYNTAIQEAVSWYTRRAYSLNDDLIYNKEEIINTHEDDIRVQVADIRASFEPFKDVKGVWKFVRPRLQYDRPRFIVGIEVDTKAYKGLNYAQDDLLGF